ncbi:MAG: helix-turn-helix domain-containing protein [Desulfobacteraceae bacterium]|jgi:sugar-specific transcriptional regulator TrmB
MTEYEKLKTLGFSQYEITCYLTLAARHPINGSRISRISGMARSRVYDVLRNMVRKGFVLEVGDGLYVPLPAEELYKRLQREFDEGMEALKEQLNGKTADAAYEFIWMIRGYEKVIAKAREMIAAARTEIYVRLFPESGDRLQADLIKAEQRGVGVRYIAMGDLPTTFNIQVTHPYALDLIETIGGRSFDIITDKSEALVGIFEKGQEDVSPINWTRNRWFVISNRDSLRHDFYHCFLDKIIERGETLSDKERQIYGFIKADN